MHRATSFLVLPFIAFGLAAGLPLDAGAKGPQNQNNKVTICHVPPGNPSNAHTISVGPAAVSPHLDHGDHLGACSAVIIADLVHWESTLTAFLESDPLPAQRLEIHDADGTAVIIAELVGMGDLTERAPGDPGFSQLNGEADGGAGRDEPPLADVLMGTQSLRLFNAAAGTSSS